MLLFGLALFLQAHASQAQRTCPWLTQGTAAAVLGAPPDLTLKLADPEGTCTFTLARGATLSTLQIIVTAKPQPLCASGGERLTGLGNEATFCQVHHAAAYDSVVVTGRVRTLYFSTTLVFRGSHAPAGPETPRESVQRLAEQVVGNLY